MTNFTNATQTNPAGIFRAVQRKYEARDPTTQDNIGFTLGDEWINHTTNTWWILLSLANYSALWVKFAIPTGWLTSLTGNSGGAVFGDSNQNINTLGDTTTILVAGSPGTNTLTWSVGPTVATTYHTQSGDAVPALNILNVYGAGGTTTSGSGNTITITSSGISEWIDQGVSVVATANKGYFATAAITLTMPASPSQGDHVAVFCDTAGSVVVTANTGQVMRFNTGVSSLAGTLTNSSRGDALDFVYRAATSSWMVLDNVGLWSIA